MPPCSSLIGDICTDSHIRNPSCRLHSTLNNSTSLLWAIRSKRLSTCCKSSGKVSAVSGLPSISSAGYPQITSAALFQLVTTESSVTLMMASS